MKACELRLVEHGTVPGAQAVEVLRDGVLIAQITSADFPGVRVISKHALSGYGIISPELQIIEIRIDANR